MKRRGRKRSTFYRKYRAKIKELTNQFLESESAKAYIGRAVLAMVGLGGILFVGAVAPNLFSAFGRLAKSKEYNEKQIYHSFFYIRKRGLAKLIKKSDRTFEVKITRKGRIQLAEFAIESITFKNPGAWDGKWRVVIFDIPERYSSVRDSLRHKFRELGLFQFQRSVFVYPYSKEDEIQFVAAYFGVEKYLEILTVERMLDDKDLRRYFRL